MMRLVFTVLLAILLWLSRAAFAEPPPPPPTIGELAAGGRAGQALSLAEGLLQRQFYDLAEVELREFAENYPDHALLPRVMFRLAEALQQQGREAEAIDVLRTARDRFPEDPLLPRIRLLLGAILFERGDYDGALAEYRQVIARAEPVFRETAMFFSAEIFAERRELDKAIPIYRQLGERPFDDPRHGYRPFALLAYARILLEQEDWPAAAEALSRLAEESGTPGPLRSEAFLLYAEALFRQDKFEAALEAVRRLSLEFSESETAAAAEVVGLRVHHATGDYSRLVEAAEDWQSRYPEALDHEVEYLLALGLFELERYESALTRWRRLAGDREAPEHLARIALFYEVVCGFRLERYSEAAAAGRRFVEQYPEAEERPEVHYFSALARHREQEFEAAAEECRAALKRAEEGWEYALATTILLAETMQGLERAGDAAEVFRTAAALAGEDEEKRISLRLNAARMAERAGDTEAAIADYRELLESVEAGSEVSRNLVIRLGRLYAETDQLAAAERLFSGLLEDEQEIEREPILMLLGYIQSEIGKLQEAQQTFGLLVEQGTAPEVVNEAKLFRGRILLELERQDQALTLFAELLQAPAEQRPRLPASLLLELQETYFRQGEYKISETICRELLEHESVEIRQAAALQLAEVMIARRRLDEAESAVERLRQEMRGRESGQAMVAEAEIQALLGEILFLRGDMDQAATVLQAGLARGGMRDAYSTRSRWLLAEIFRGENRLNQGLRQATNAFVLGDHPVYVPRAMLLAIEILVELERMDEAKTTWREMQSRFPVFADQHRENQALRKLDL